MVVVLVFLLMSVVFMFSSVVFIFFVGLYLFMGLNVFSWGGYFVVFDSYLFVVMAYMSLFVMSLIVMCELSGVMVFLSEVLVLVCLLFFFSSNMMMLYIFFELSIFPVIIMILGFGAQVEKIGATYYLIFYAVMCSSPFLYVYFCSNFYLFFAYYSVVVSYEGVVLLTLCFLVKFPVYFLHLWLPKAHVEAPTTASMLLAGLLLKLGTLGYVRLMIVYNYVYIFFWGVLGLLGMVLASFLCLLQSDAKSLVAYSSVVHMSFVLFVLILMVDSGKLSGSLMMVSHGYVSTLMFYLVGEFFHITGTRVLNYLGGFMSSGMMLGYMMILVFLCNGGLPPSLSFFSEFAGLVGLFMMFKGLFIFLFVYFFVAFYYSLFILTGALMGSGLVMMSYNYLMCMCPGVVLMFNFFWLGLLF